MGVLGGGGFGRGLAAAAARAKNEVTLWSRSARELPAGVESTGELAALGGCDVIFLAVPSGYVESLSTELGRHLDGSHVLVHVSRGLVGPQLGTLSQLLRRTTPCRRVGALAGPLIAEALASGAPSGAVVGTRFQEVAGLVRDAIASEGLRLYESADIVGVEVSSALVGLLALAVGYGRGLGAGPASLSVVLTRGLAEARRLLPTLGGQADTLNGLAGFGDMLAVAAGDARPEVRLGEALAAGQSVEEAGRVAGAYIEGLTIGRRVAAHAERAHVDVPVARAMAQVIAGELAGEAAVRALMARHAGRE